MMRMPWLRTDGALSRTWPLAAAAVLAVVGTVGGVYGLSWRTQVRSLQSTAPKVSTAADIAAAADSHRVNSVPAEQFHADLQRIFSIAAQNRIALGQLTYGREAPSAAPYDVRTVDIRITENYGRSKAFIAAVLESLNNAMLSGLRMERKESGGDKGQVSMRISLVYDRDANAQNVGAQADSAPGVAQ